MSKPKIATEWLAACAGCHMSLLDMDERLLKVLELVQLTSCPITDLKHPPHEGVEVGVLTGAVNSTTNVAVARMMRKRCKCLVALGDCAVFGGIANMRNFFDMQDALRCAYVETPSTVEGFVPSSEELGKPVRARSVDQVVKVDICLPGCPPSADAIFHVLSELAQGRIPELSGETLKYD